MMHLGIRDPAVWHEAVLIARRKLMERGIEPLRLEVSPQEAHLIDSRPFAGLEVLYGIEPVSCVAGVAPGASAHLGYEREVIERPRRGARVY